MTTKEVLEKLPQKVLFQVEKYRNERKSLDEANQRDYEKRGRLIDEAHAYLKGLRDGGLITDRERQILFIYTTV